MNRPNTRARREVVTSHRQHERLMRTIVVVGIVASVGGFALVASAREDHTEQTAPVTPPVAVDGAAAPAAIVNTDAAEVGAQRPRQRLTPSRCPISRSSRSRRSSPTAARSSRRRSRSTPTASRSSACSRRSPERASTTAQLTGEFDFATSAAVEELQIERGLFVDGVAGRETGLELGIWPEEQLEVVRTPPPPPGSMDSWGYPLSSVSSIGDDAPPLPENSGSGQARRVRADQPAGVGRRRGRQHRAVVARVRQPVQQRDPGHVHRVQPVRTVDGLERPGDPAVHDPLAADRHRAHRLPWHSAGTSRTARRTRPRTSWEPGSPADVSVSPTPTPGSSGSSLPRAPPSSFSDPFTRVRARANYPRNMSFEGRRISEPSALRALSHPLRLRIIELLEQAGPITATAAAAHFGTTPSNCSFHLRLLAKHGFIEEADGASRAQPAVATGRQPRRDQGRRARPRRSRHGPDAHRRRRGTAARQRAALVCREGRLFAADWREPPAKPTSSSTSRRRSWHTSARPSTTRWRRSGVTTPDDRERCRTGRVRRLGVAARSPGSAPRPTPRLTRRTRCPIRRPPTPLRRSACHDHSTGMSRSVDSSRPWRSVQKARRSPMWPTTAVSTTSGLDRSTAGDERGGHDVHGSRGAPGRVVAGRDATGVRGRPSR